jgi:Tol biopolymer transport system component
MRNLLAIVLMISACAHAGTERVSVSSAAVEANERSFAPKTSDDGRYVVFESQASNFVATDTNGTYDVFLRDRQTGITTCMSCVGTVTGNSSSRFPAISGDGRFVAFHSNASNLVAGDTNSTTDVIVRNVTTGTMEIVSRTNGASALGNSASTNPYPSSDGRYVSFLSFATNLVSAADTNGDEDAFVRDRMLGTTQRVSVATGGAQADGIANQGVDSAVISGDGR